MKKVGLLSLLIIVSISAFAQAPERKDVRRGNKLYNKNEYEKAEIAYRHGLEKDSASYGARFNLADALYQKNEFEEAENIFQSLTSQDADDSKKAKLFHNLANSRLQQVLNTEDSPQKQKKIQESIDAYKQSLRIDPADEETRANLAYAQILLQQEQNNQNQNQGQNQQNQEQNQSDNNQNKNNNDEQQDRQDKQNQEQNQDTDNRNNQDQPQPQQKMSPQDAQRILEAVQAKEKETQDKVQKEKARLAGRQTIEKNW